MKVAPRPGVRPAERPPPCSSTIERRMATLNPLAVLVRRVECFTRLSGGSVNEGLCDLLRDVLLRVRRATLSCGPFSSGGLLGEAYIHGMNGITEAVRQIRGTSVNQVPSVEHVLVTAGTGCPTS